MHTTLKKGLPLVLFLLLTSSIFSRSYFVQIGRNTDASALLKIIAERAERFSPGFEFRSEKAFVRLSALDLDRVWVIALPEATGPELLSSLSKLPGVVYLEEVPEYRFDYSPNDYNSSQLWHLAKISAPLAWDLERGGKGIVVGLVDDGLDTAHSDLRPVLWRNTAEIRGNGIDDDNNGYIDDYFGWDVADNDNDPSVTPSQGLSHGTHCAGIAAAATDNNNGISSVGFQVRVMAIKTGRVGQSGLYNPYRGVEYAMENGARVISMSWGGGSYSRTYQTLFDLAYQNNIVCVAAAGNSNDSFRNYPAAYRHVIAVGSTAGNDAKSSFSCYGAWVDVMAPGSSIYSTLPGNTYGNKSGTSMACPMVSGLCALMLSRNASMSAAAVEACLKSSCDNISSQNSSYTGLIGSGRINAYRSLQCVKPLNALFSSSKSYVCTGDTVRYYDKSSPASTSRTWSFQGGSPSVSTAKDPVVRYNTPGTYRVQLISASGVHTDTLIRNAYITVGKPTARFSGNQTVNKGEFSTVRIDFTGNPPWDLVYRTAAKRDTLRNILHSPYFLLKTADSNRVYHPVSVSSGNCTGSVSDSAVVRVILNGNASCDSAYRFHLNFGGSGDDYAYAVASGKDSLMFVAGLSNSQGAGGNDAMIACLSPSGKLEWFRTLGGSADDGFLTMTTDQADNVYCGGYSFSNVNYRAAMMVKYDRRGNLKWKRYYNGMEREYLYDVMVSADQRYVYFTGHSISDNYGGEDYCIYKFDTAGVVQWVKRFGSVNTERPYALAEDDSANIYALGSVSLGSEQNAYIVKMNSSGSGIFSKYYSNGGSSQRHLFSDALLWDRNHFIVIGTNTPSPGPNRRLLISKMSTNGTMVWTREVSAGAPGPIPKIRRIGNRLVIANYTSISSRMYGHILVLDSNGNTLVSKQLGNSTMNLYLNQLDLTSDQGLVYAGYQNAGNNQFMLGRTNCSFNNVCLFGDYTVSSASYTYTSVNYTVSSKDFTSVITPNHSNNNYSLNSTFNCRSQNIAVSKQCALRADFRVEQACTGDSVVFTDMSSDSSGYLLINRSWEFGDGSRISGPATVKHSYRADGMYPVRLVVVSASGNLTCSDTAVRIYRSEDALKIVSMPADTVICTRDSLQLSPVEIVCGTPPFVYAWAPAAGLSDSTSSRPYFAPRTPTRYVLTVSDSRGITVSDSVRIDLDQSCCKSRAMIKPEKEYVCLGDSLRFLNASVFDSSSVYFRWIFSGANIATYVGKQAPAVLFNAAGMYQVQLELSDLCNDDTSILMYRVRALPSADAGRDTVLCRRDTLSLGSESFGMNRYVWSPSAGLSSPVVSDPLLVSDSNGLYTVRVTDEFGCSQTDSVRITHRFLPFRVSSDTSYCAGDSVMLRIPGTGGYLWSNGLQTQTAWFSRPGLVWAQRSAECNYRDSILISEAALPDFSLGSDTGYCRGASLRLGAGIPGSYYWSDGSSGTSLIVSSPGIYWLRVSTGSCSSTDSVAVKEWALPVFSLGPDRKICRDPLLLSPSVYYPGSLYGWNTGQTDSSIRSGLPGLYILRVSSTQGCSYTDSVQLNAGQLAQLSAIPAVYKCSGHTYRMELPVIPGQSYEWYDGSSGPVKLFTQSGTYSVKARTECGDTSIGFTVNDSSCTCGVWLPNVFTPNGDQKNDLYGPVSECSLIEYSMKIYTRWGEMVYETHDPGAAWDGTYKGKTVPVGVYMYVIEFRKDLPGFKEYNALNGTFLLME